MVTPLLEKRLAFILIALSMIAAYAALGLSGATKDIVLAPPLSGAGNAGINAYLLVLAAIAIPLAYAAASIYSIGDGEPETGVALASIFAAPIVFYFAGISLQAAVISSGIIISVIYSMRSAFHDKEHFKKIDASAIARKAASKGILIISAALAFSVFFTFYSDPALTLNTVDSMVKGISGFSISDMNNITQSAAEQQKQASYAWIESIEASVKDAVAMNLEGMAPNEQAACQKAIDSRMTDIDLNAKREIGRQIGDGSSGGFDMGYTNRMTSLLVSWYPFIAAITIFALVEFARSILIAPLAGIYAWLLWRKYGSPEARI